MFVSASANGVGDLPGRSAPIVDAIQPETINFNGVFRVTAQLESRRWQEMVWMDDKGVLRLRCGRKMLTKVNV